MDVLAGNLRGVEVLLDLVKQAVHQMHHIFYTTLLYHAWDHEDAKNPDKVRRVVFVFVIAESPKIPKLYLHAQADAIPFYEKHGFIAEGEIFYEADIPHRSMFKNLC